MLVVVIIAITFLSDVSYAQVQNVRLENLSVEDGLSQASVNYVYQDKDDFVWVSTDAGIQAYDGYNFKNISGPDGDFSSFSVYKIYESDDGLIWIDVYGKGLYTFDKSTQTYELMLKTDEENSIAHFYYGNNKKVWIATVTAIGYLDRKTKTFIKEVDLRKKLGPKNSIYHIFEKHNILYIATKNGVFAYHIANKKLLKLPSIAPQNTTTENYSVEETTKAYSVMVIEKTLFIGTNDGVFTLDVSNIEQFYSTQQVLPKYELIIPHISVWQFYFYNNLLLVGANEGLYEFNLDTKKANFLLGFDFYSLSIANNYVTTLIVDKNGIYWMGSLSDGLFLWDPTSVNVQNYGYQKGSEKSLSNNQVSTILDHKTQKNLLWVGTINGLNLIDLGNQHVERIIQPADPKTSFTKNNINHLFHGLDNQLWLSTAVGLKLYDIKEKVIIPLPFDKNINQLLSSEQYGVHVENGYLWYSTETHLFRINLVTHQLDTLPEISAVIEDNIIGSFLGHVSSNPDEFWFSANLALWKFNLQDRVLVKVYQHPEISDGEWSNIDSILIDESKGIAWIAFVLQGLIGVLLETNEVIHYFEQNNSILNKNIYGVQQDDDGDIWVSTHNGIFVLDTKTSHIRRFGVDHGLIGDEFNSNAFTTLADGRFVYGAMNGLSIFDPIQLKNNELSKPLNIVVTNLTLLSRNIIAPFFLKNNEEITLEYDDVGIRVDFTTFDFSHTKEAIFEYNLNNQGFNPLGDNYIVFPSLKSGEHSLQIRAKSRLSGQYSATTNLLFQVSYAPWRSPTAYIFYAVIIISLFAFWLNKREKQRAELLAVHEQVKFRENRLQLALKVSNSDVWDWHSENNLFTANRFKNLQSNLGNHSDLSFTDFLSKMHPDDGASFVATWQRFIESADISETFSCTYRLKDDHNEWLWFKDLGKIVELDNNNRPTRVAGSYTNITQTKVDEERAQYYGEAFRQTKDWVVIINQDFTKVTSNAAIREVFGWEQEEFPFHLSLLGFDRKKIKFYTDIVLSLGANKHWRGEELITSATGQDFHVILNISVGSNFDGNIHYIFVFTDISAQKLAENELRYLANYDHLTGLPNRALLLERVEQAISRAARKKDNIALFFIDLDRFKKINDTLGHDFGDILLVEITKRLTEVLRQDDTIARQGGDEFVVLLERFSSPDKLARIAQKIINITEEPFQLKETVVSIGCSIGIALYPNDGLNPTELFKNSDIAMYCAKQNGRNNFQFFEPSMNDAAAKRLVQEAKIKQAIKEDQFVNHYQPIVDAHIGKAVGVEMLMRWPTDEGMVSPDEFIPLAEDLNLIISMTEVALKPALIDLVEWRKCRPDFYLSVNISARHFIKGQLVEFITKALQQYNLPTSAIKLEVTESAFISEPEIAIEQMTRLKKLGIQLSLDDFGTGYSSLSYLKSLPIDVIKIDRSFISNIGEENADEAIIEAIILLAKNLSMSCIAEGVETKEQLNFLVSRKCHFIQGYFYSKALPHFDILSMVEENLDDYRSII
ncbi:MAG: diguanylate cyclase (GGDEF)-like protein/PAS domain S-box-containing protein [Paraglaciecola sp.]